MNAVRTCSVRFPEFIARLKDIVLDYLVFVWSRERRENNLGRIDEEYYRNTFLDLAVNGTDYSYLDYVNHMVSDEDDPLDTIRMCQLMDLQNYINSYLHDQLGNDRDHIVWNVPKLYSLTAYVIAHSEITFEEFLSDIEFELDYMNRHGAPRQ